MTTNDVHASALAEAIRADIYRGELALLFFAHESYRLAQTPGVRCAIGAYAYEKEIKLDGLKAMYHVLGWRYDEKPSKFNRLSSRSSLAREGVFMRDLAAAAQMKALEGALSTQYAVLERWTPRSADDWIQEDLAAFRRSSLKPISMWWNAANRIISNDNFPDHRAVA